jgi:hypothetical protein
LCAKAAAVDKEGGHQETQEKTVPTCTPYTQLALDVHNYKVQVSQLKSNLAELEQKDSNIAELKSRNSKLETQFVDMKRALEAQLALEHAQKEQEVQNVISQVKYIVKFHTFFISLFYLRLIFSCTIFVVDNDAIFKFFFLA